MPQLVHVGRLMRSARRAAPAGPFTPASLGASLLAWWSADRGDLITQSGGVVSSWKDSVAAYDCTAAGSVQPAYSATGWKGASPGITFDGVDDCLTLAS